MKKLKAIIQQITSTEPTDKEALNALIWEFICYSPQWPLRHHQQQLLDEAEKFSLTVYDEHFAKGNLNVNGFKWGAGKTTILLTHGWGSKAADFYEMIIALKALDLTILSFDAPGNGSSEGSLSNLLLYAAGVKGLVERFGTPEIAIGHSLGAMANVVALRDTPPALLISLSPLIRLEENFIASMSFIQVQQQAQEYFLESFKHRFNVLPADFNMNDLYQFDAAISHWLAHDKQDIIAPYPYLEEFLQRHQQITAAEFENVGHERMIKDDTVVAEVAGVIESYLTNNTIV